MIDDITTPEWPDIIRALQAQLQERLHTALPGIVQSYDVATQTCTVQLAVQLRGANVPPLAEVPVAWPGGAAGFVHIPLAQGDTVMVVFAEADFGGWWSTGSVSAPVSLARHGLHAMAIPGLRRASAALGATGGHVTIAATSEVRLGSDSATHPVALGDKTAAALAILKSALDAAMSTLNGVSPGISVAWGTATSSFDPTTVPATKVKAV